MNKMTRPSQILALGLFLAAAAAVAGAGRAEATEVRRVNERLIPFQPGGQLRIDDKNGNITIEGWPRNEVRIQVTRVVRAEDRTKAEELIKELEAEVEVHSDRIVVESRFPKRRESIGIWDLLKNKVAQLQINYFVQVPNETDLMLETANGKVFTRGVTGQLDAKTTNGDMRVDGVNGVLNLATTNGEISMAGVTNKVFAQTTNGSVVAEIRRISPAGFVELKTTNGNVETYLPRDIRATVDAVTTNGHVSIAFPVEREGLMTSKTVRGTIQGGGVKLVLGTTNGNVEVRKLGSSDPGKLPGKHRSGT